MMRRAALALLLVACTSGAARVPARRTAAADGRRSAAARVVLVSFDGLGADELAKRPDLAAFAQIERDGMFVRRVTPVTPCVTSSAHVAILTGTPPSVNGIVANRFHKAGTPWTEIADGFTADIDGETLVEAAHRQGKRVGSIAFPTVDGRNARRTADFGLVYVEPVEKPRTVHMTPADFERFRPSVDGHGWFAVGEGACGSWAKVLSTTTDDITVYWGPKTCTDGYPASFLQLVDREVGFWPGPADPTADREIFMEQNARLAAFLANVTALAVKHMPFDLLLAYEPIVDAAEHRSLATDDEVVSRSFTAADGAVQTIEAAVDPARDALIVTGDHGLAPIDTEVHLKRLLTDWGFDRNWLAIGTGGGVAEMYCTTAPADCRTNDLAEKFKATPYIERIDPKTHPNSGDLALFAWPHVVLSPANGEAVTKPRSSGQHGGVGSHHEFQTVLIAWGAGVKRGEEPALPQTEVAPFVCRLLGISTPRGPAESASAPRESPRR